MKIKNDYILHKLAGNNIVVGVDGEADNLGGALTLSETSAYMWHILENGATKEELIEKMLAEYDVGRAQLEEDVSGFIAKLESFGVLE